ncbi:MAG: calcium/sodium antiporter [Myxococcota bacterium]
MMDLLLVLGGVALLYGGGELLVRYASGLGRALGMSPLIVGLTIVSFGTSAPELASTLSATLKGAPAIAVGNVVGSNIANIGLVVGLVALLRPLPAQGKLVRIDTPVMVAVCLVFVLACVDGLLGRLEAGILVTCLALFIYSLFRRNKGEAPSETEESDAVPIWQSIIGITLGLGALMVGAELLIEGATTIARTFGVSERVIGLTLVALGTSLPELASSLVAAFREEVDLLMGNIIGSNIFNVLAVAGTTGLVAPIEVSWSASARDMAVMVAFAVALWIGLGLRGGIRRIEGALLTLGYALYMVML